MHRGPAAYAESLDGSLKPRASRRGGAHKQARVEVDTVLGFVRGPVLVVLQFVDLHEP